MDARDRVLLNAVQNHFPLEIRPYLTLGKAVGMTEDEAYRRLQRLRQDGIIRRLGGVFDSRRLGYFSTLCAAKVPEGKISALADLLQENPGVTHNYLRNHEYNVWFTLITPSEAAAEGILQNIRGVLDLPEIYSLPAKRVFKINVNFDFDLADGNLAANNDPEPVVDSSLAEDEADGRGTEERVPIKLAPLKLDEEDIELIRVLQGSLPPDTLTPYNVLAEELHWQLDAFLSRATRLLEAETMRRFGAVLRHQKAGFLANAMGVWLVEPEKAAGAGKIMARFKEVSHCYQRPTLPDWPYSLFTMIHGRTAQDCENVMGKIAKATGLNTYALLFSTDELKKSSMRYFMEETN